MPAARIGPTVCELDGPMPTLKSSKALMVISELLPLKTYHRFRHPNRHNLDVIVTQIRDKPRVPG
jgi:hypothetical protein